MMPSMRPAVFISYSTRDQSWKDLLCDSLKAARLPYFLDEKDILPGSELLPELEQKLRETSCSVLVVTENSLLSNWVGVETMFRLHQEHTEAQTRLFCAIADPAVLRDDFPVAMQARINQQRAQLEKLREEMRRMEGRTKFYDEIIDRVSGIHASDIMRKVHLQHHVRLDDPARRKAELERLVEALRKVLQNAGPGEVAGRNQGQNPRQIPHVNPAPTLVNDVLLTPAQLQQLAQAYQVQSLPGNYWYDHYTGAWGHMGGPCQGYLMAGLPLPGPMRQNVSGGGTGIAINGRELHPMDVQALQAFMQPMPGRYWMDAQGNFGWEGYPMMALGNLFQLFQARFGYGGGGGGGHYQQNPWSGATTSFGGDGNTSYFSSKKSDGTTYDAYFGD